MHINLSRSLVGSSLHALVKTQESFLPVLSVNALLDTSVEAYG